MLLGKEQAQVIVVKPLSYLKSQIGIRIGDEPSTITAAGPILGLFYNATTPIKLGHYRDGSNWRAPQIHAHHCLIVGGLRLMIRIRIAACEGIDLFRQMIC